LCKCWGIWFIFISEFGVGVGVGVWFILISERVRHLASKGSRAAGRLQRQQRVRLDIRYSELQAGQKFKYINGRANTTGIETLGLWCRHGVRARNGRAGVGRAQGTAGARMRLARKRERDLAQAKTGARV
jgi:hypothetical protein